MHTAYSLLGNWWYAGSGSQQARQAVWSEGQRKGQCGSMDGRVSERKAPARQAKVELSGPPETDFRAKLENNLQTNCCSAQAANPPPLPTPHTLNPCRRPTSAPAGTAACLSDLGVCVTVC